MNTNKGSIVKKSGNDVEGCRSEKILVQPNMRVFLQYSVNSSSLTFLGGQNVRQNNNFCLYFENSRRGPFLGLQMRAKENFNL